MAGSSKVRSDQIKTLVEKSKLATRHRPFFVESSVWWVSHENCVYDYQYPDSKDLHWLDCQRRIVCQEIVTTAWWKGTRQDRRRVESVDHLRLSKQIMVLHWYSTIKTKRSLYGNICVLWPYRSQLQVGKWPRFFIDHSALRRNLSWFLLAESPRIIPSIDTGSVWRKHVTNKTLSDLKTSSSWRSLSTFLLLM